MTLAQIVTLVRGNTARTDKDDLIKSAVQLGLNRVVSNYSFRMSEITVDLDVAPGSFNISLPATPVRIIKAYWIAGTQSWPLLVKSREWASKRVPEPSALSTSKPQWGYLEGNRLKFMPGSVDAGVIRITYQPALTMTNDSDECPVPRLEESLVAFASGWLFASVQMFSQAQFWYGQANQSFMSIMMADVDQPAIEYSMDERGVDDAPFIEPYLDPFAGHRGTWWK